MARLDVPITRINTVPIPCQHYHSCSTLRSPRMRSQSRLLSLPDAVIAFCRSLKFKRIINPPIRHRSHPCKLPTQSQIIPSKTQQPLNVGVEGNDSRADIEPFRQSPALTDATNNSVRYLGVGDSRGLANQENLSGVVEWSDSATSNCGPGGKIIKEDLLEDEVPNLTEIFDEPTTQPEQIPPRSQSPSPELSFTPLSPPPSHRNSRKADAIVGPDDPRHLGVPLCNEHLCFPCSRCSQEHHNEPLRFPF